MQFFDEFLAFGGCEKEYLPFWEGREIEKKRFICAMMRGGVEKISTLHLRFVPLNLISLLFF